MRIFCKIVFLGCLCWPLYTLQAQEGCSLDSGGTFNLHKQTKPVVCYDGSFATSCECQ